MIFAQLPYDPMAGDSCYRTYNGDALILLAVSGVVVLLLGLLLWQKKLRRKPLRTLAWVVIGALVLYWAVSLLVGQTYFGENLMRALAAEAFEFL